VTFCVLFECISSENVENVINVTDILLVLICSMPPRSCADVTRIQAGANWPQSGQWPFSACRGHVYWRDFCPRRRRLSIVRLGFIRRNADTNTAQLYCPIIDAAMDRMTGRSGHFACRYN